MNLAGLHDREALAVALPDTWIVDTIALSESPQPANYAAGFHWICRVNWGYGSTGTLPRVNRYGEFERRLTGYVRAARGCTRWVIGNEPNLSREWPDGRPIMPWQYAECYQMARQAIHGIPGHEADEVLIAAPGPWNNELKYAGNVNGDWIQYFVDVIEACGRKIDGFALHAYTHGYNVELVRSSAKMDAPFYDRHYHFRTALDYLDAIPDALAGLPSYLTEANGDGPWQAVGLMPAMLDEVTAWNATRRTKIHAVVFYRYPKYDQYHIEGKADVIAEYQEAVGRDYSSPVIGTSKMPQTTHLPFVSPGTVATPNLPPRAISDDFKRRVPTMEFVEPKPGMRYFRLVEAGYYPDGAARFGPDHHILVEVLDANGQRKLGAPVNFTWGGGGLAIVPANKVGGPYAADYGMTSAGYGFGVWVGDLRDRSDYVFGMGLGTIEQPDWNHHVTYSLIFQEVEVPQVSQPSSPRPPTPVPALVHPVAEPRGRGVTQVFRVNGDYYKRFSVDGVPLKGHNGIDFGTPEGIPIVAVDSGEVVEVADDPGGYGRYVKLTHVWGESLYAHLSVQAVGAGETVGRGQWLGDSGDTGNSSGPHLHFGMRVHPFDRRDGWGGFTDPAPYLISLSEPTQPGQPVPNLTTLVKAAAAEFQVDWQLLAALAWAESSFRVEAKSAVGAMGLTQLMPPTWAEWAEKVGATNPFDAQDNLRTGAAYLAWCIDVVDGDAWAALVAYNWGIGNLLSGADVPAETRAYVDRVVFGRDLLKAVSA